MELTVVNMKKFPADLHLEIKMAALKGGKTLRDWMIEAAREKLEREKDSQK